ncbi:Coatomer subunit epsilon-1 [Phytophthora nicotianae]|uniref:Coatomer subunit epsilon-1 n=1 Tax=Phytophthora nicotianae TaxID=4792 RepID=A0A0W8DKD7_PHYNI|nr:Coatomer subunit epsilon-1 [Phytophthora nicotianae]
MDYEARVTRNGVSANHLLNFSMPEPPLDHDTIVPTWDLEALTEWSSVEQILLWYDVESPQTCPICMDTFRAPKITKCGHIFCVQLQQLQIPPHVGSDVTFQFLERPKSSMFPQLRVLPTAESKGEHAETDASSHSTQSTPEAVAFAARKRSRKLPNVNDVDAIYSRILEATPEYLRELLYSEMRDLQSMDTEFRSSGDVDSLPFVEEAMRNTSGRLAKSDDFSHGTYRQANSASNSTAGKKSTPKENGSGDAYSFYQIADGTYVVLHPLNMKCLLKEYSDEHQHEQEHGEDAHLEAAWIESSSASAEPLPVDRYHLLPERIHGKVLDIEHVVMDEEAQKRYRFLSHLPRFCDFYICELDLTSQLSSSTLNTFRNDLKKRAKQRKHKHKQNAPIPSSPIFKRNADAFSLQEEGMMWPSPYEQALAESLEEFHLSNSSVELDAEHHSAADEERSFARVTENSGYFPALGGAAAREPRPHVTDPIAFGSPSAWGNASTSPPAVAWSSGKGGKKKGAGKKGVSVFSTTQRLCRPLTLQFTPSSTSYSKTQKKMTKIAIIYYSTYGHIATMAESVKKGVESVDGVTAEVYQVQETLSEEILTKMHAPPKKDHPVATPDILKNADGVLLGFPTRFGSMPAQVKALFDACGGLWAGGALVGKPAGIFFSTGTLGGGQETTAFTSVTFLTHQGMTFVPLGYRSPLLFNLEEIHGGSPWGAGTIAGGDGSRQPSQLELDVAKVQGESFAGVAKKLSA